MIFFVIQFDSIEFNEMREKRQTYQIKLKNEASEKNCIWDQMH